MVDRAIFWLTDRYDDLKERVARALVADEEMSREMDRADQELDLHEELAKIFKAQEGRSN